MIVFGRVSGFAFRWILNHSVAVLHSVPVTACAGRTKFVIVLLHTDRHDFSKKVDNVMCVSILCDRLMNQIEIHTHTGIDECYCAGILVSTLFHDIDVQLIARQCFLVVTALYWLPGRCWSHSQYTGVVI